MGGFLVWIVIVLFLIVNANKKKKTPQAGKPSAPAQPGQMTPEALAKLEALRAQAAVPQARTVPLAQMSAQERAARMRELKQKRAERVANARGTAAQAAEAAPTFAEGESYGGSLFGQGVTATDDEGCVGGSLAHDHSEGESRAEHSAHIAAMRARDAEEAAVAAPGNLADFDPRDLRRAVVISEILGKPRALKASGTRQ